MTHVFLFEAFLSFFWYSKFVSQETLFAEWVFVVIVINSNSIKVLKGSKVGFKLNYYNTTHIGDRIEYVESILVIEILGIYT